MAPSPTARLTSSDQSHTKQCLATTTTKTRDKLPSNVVESLEKEWRREVAARGSWCWWYGEEDGGDGGKERKLLDLGSGEGDHPRGREIPPLPPPHKDLKPWGGKGGG